MKVYVYKNYNDSNAYGEESIRVFERKESAEAALRADVENCHELLWKDIPDEMGLTEEDTFEPDYVSIHYGDGDTIFWIIEEKEVE